jgi:hypothetical protein
MFRMTLVREPGATPLRASSRRNAITSCALGAQQRRPWRNAIHGKMGYRRCLWLAAVAERHDAAKASAGRPRHRHCAA